MNRRYVDTEDMLPMSHKHVTLILAGLKWSTLRRERSKAESGRWELRVHHQLLAKVTLVDDGFYEFEQFMALERDLGHRSEGYADPGEFQSAASKIYPNWVKGEIRLQRFWIERVTPVGSPEFRTGPPEGRHNAR